MPSGINLVERIDSEFTAFALGRCMLNVETRAWAAFQEILRLEVNPIQSYSEQFECHFEEIDTLRRQYTEYLTEIYELVGEQMVEEYYNCAKRIENILSDCNALLVKLVSKTFQSRKKKSVEVKFAKDGLSFGGQIQDWVEFRVAFEERVVNNLSLETSEKLAMLNKSVSKSVKTEQRGESFDALWSKLRNEFDRQAIIFHVDGLFCLKNLSSSSNPEDVHTVLNKCDHHVQSLEKLGYSLNYLIDVMVGRILKLRIPFCIHRTLDQIGTWSGIKKALPGLISSKRSAQASTNDLECYYCGGKHFVRTCNDFRRLPFSDRYKMIAIKRKICTICFSVYHLAKQCPTWIVCEICNHKHNTALHPEDDDERKIELLNELVG